MYKIEYGEINIDNVNISESDSLTSVLQKTLNLKKEIQNTNNHQYLYITDCIICDTFTYCCICFSDIGKMESISLCFPMGDKRNTDKEIFLDFFKKYNIYDNYSFKSGMIELSFEPHFMEYSIRILFQ